MAASNKAAVIVAHHASKNAVLTGQSAKQQAARGASGIIDAVRLGMTMRTAKSDDEVILAYSKRNGCPDPGEIYFKRESNGFLRNAERCGTKGRTRRQTKNTASGALQTDVLEAISKGTRTRKKPRNNDDKQ